MTTEYAAEQIVSKAVDAAGRAGGIAEVSAIASKGPGEMMFSDEDMVVLVDRYGSAADAMHAIQIEARRRVSGVGANRAARKTSTMTTETTIISSVAQARAAFLALCDEYDSDPIAEEDAILSVGRECLPPCAIVVLDDSDAATVEYYEWLTEQISTAWREDALARDGH